MGRKVRIFLPDYPQHIQVAGKKGLSLFSDKEDIGCFLQQVQHSAKAAQVYVYAYGLTSAQANLLLQPKSENSIARFMQNLMRNYTRYYNTKYQHSGTIYQGRYKNSLIEPEFYFLDVMQYIEQLPELLHSSLSHHLTGQSDALITAHPLYQSLGQTPAQQQQAYQKRISQPLPRQRVQFIQTSVEKQKITARSSFIKQLEHIIGASLFVKKRGRPRKNQLKELKMSQTFTVLSNESHKELKINPLQNLNFAKGLVSIPLLATEAANVAKDFPVVFTVDENNNASLVALVSLGGENLAINEQGKWIAEYVPATLRKHPFALATTEDQPDQKIVLIDEDATVLSLTEGQPLFTEEGDATEALNHAVEFLKSFDEQAQATQNLANEVNQANILIEQEISVESGDTTQVLVSGFKVVDREKLNALEDEKLADWTRRGIIGLIEMHLKSLENINRLFALASQKQA